MVAEQTIHPFEAAGLGMAPFRMVGFSEEKFVACPGATAKPGATCDYCGQAIMSVFHIRSADGKKFKVGCDCVEKTEDRGLTRDAHKFERDRQHKKDDARIQAAFGRLDDAAICERLGGELNYIRFCQKNAGRTGKLKCARMIERVVTK